ncbi:hypothetical protein FEM48_Zijuj05G0064900 [Ziziphus jujuba var. spinosa]|uniref:Uncharacterized protein n=1 Tax=Ziziphus jujuba var. spinosa TaxID=714518 RepID=A0A978VDC7_ZIZJJ|nr:hypothetical protein FEM48_Zijuj05G0064900 [Ziziphus jujuba var. spinosa]
MCIIGRKYEEKQGKSRFAELSGVMEPLVASSLGDHFPYLGLVDFFTDKHERYESNGFLEMCLQRSSKITPSISLLPKTRVIINAEAIQRDPRIWENQRISFQRGSLWRAGNASMDHKELDMSEANGHNVHKKIPLLLNPIPYSWIHHLRI